MAYETKEGDFIINDNGGKKKSLDDADGTGKFYYRGSHYKTLKLYQNKKKRDGKKDPDFTGSCLLYTSPSPRDGLLSRMPSSA